VSAGAWLGAGAALASAGWGANQFAPLLVLYQERLGLSSAVVDAMFGLYALGLIPALLVGGRLSDRVGRRRIVLIALIVSAAATTVLMIGADHPGLLYVGRLLAGVASGLTFGPGTAWLKELSADAGDAAAGPLRATISMTVGFASGPLAAGLLAQWLPAPAVTAYIPHLALIVIAALAAAPTPDPGSASVVSVLPKSIPPRASVSVLSHFLAVLLPFAPWVFGSAAIALAYLPVLVANRVSAHALLFSAIATSLTAVTGIAIQPLAHRLHRPNRARLLLAAMLVVLAGLGCAVLAADQLSPVVVLVACAVLGAGYGLAQFAGLIEVQRIARPESLGIATAAYQVLSYIGFALPLILSAVRNAAGISPAVLLLAVLAIAAGCTIWLAIITRRTHGSLDEHQRRPAASGPARTSRHQHSTLIRRGRVP
jgi:nitrate/nitrite transporter NarK